MIRRTLAPLLVACALAPSRASAQADSTATPLGALADQRVAVLPAQSLVVADTGIRKDAPSATELLAQFDDELSFALKESAIGSRWLDAATLTRMAKRNAIMASDPHQLDTRQLRPAARKNNFAEVVGPLASDLRALTAIADCRLVMIPAEIRIERSGDAGFRAVARLAVIDTRAARIMWMGDVAGGAAARYSPARMASLAQRIVGLIVAP